MHREMACPVPQPPLVNPGPHPVARLDPAAPAITQLARFETLCLHGGRHRLGKAQTRPLLMQRLGSQGVTIVYHSFWSIHQEPHHE